MSQFPLVYQFKVKPLQENEQYGELAGAIATVVVYTETDEVGRNRSKEFLAAGHWEITEFLRVMFVCPEKVNHLDAALKKLFRQAELYGIAANYDGWGHHPHRG